MAAPTIPPQVALPLIQDRIHRLAIGFRQDEATRPGDLALIGIVEDLTEVVAQLAQAVQP